MKKKKVAYIFLIIAVTAFVSYSTVQFVNQQQVLDRQHEEIAAINEQIEANKRESEEKQRLLDEVGSPAFAESYLRENLSMIKEKEIIFSVED